MLCAVLVVTECIYFQFQSDFGCCLMFCCIWLCLTHEYAKCCVQLTSLQYLASSIMWLSWIVFYCVPSCLHTGVRGLTRRLATPEVTRSLL